jgi:threonine aldolase
MFGKSSGLFFPTGTMSNLCGIMAHCHGRGSEIILGRSSHLCLYEHGNLSTLGSIHSRQIRENDDATLPIDEVRTREQERKSR